MRVVYNPLIDMLLVGIFQGVQETVVDGTRLLDDDIKQRFGSFDGPISQRLDGLQLFEGQRTVLEHARCRTDSVEPSCQLCIYGLQFDSVICQENYAKLRPWLHAEKTFAKMF